MDYRAAKDAVLEYCGQETGGTFETLVERVMNAVYRDVLDAGPVPHEHRLFTFASVVSTYRYGMPLYVRKVLNIEDPDNDKSIWDITARGFDKSYPGTTESGTPNMAFSLGVRGVQKQPASDGVLSIVSSSTADAGSNYKIRVTGFNTSGVLVTELVTMNGTTAVTTTNSYDSELGVERVVKAPASGYTFAGNVTVSDDDANTISIIPVWWESPDYEWIQMHPQPSAVITYNLRAEMRKPPLVNDSDWPEFDQDFHDLLVWGSTKELLPGLGKGSTGAAHRLTYKDRMARFTREKEPASSAVFVFSNVQAAVGIQQRPMRPLIGGVDIGLGTAS